MRSTGRSFCLSASVAAVTFAVGPTPTQAESFNPTVAQALTADRGSDGEAQYDLPDNPQVVWQSRLQGTVTHAPAVAPSGALVVASAGRLNQIGADGKRDWSHRIHGATAAAPPVISATGTRIVITTGGAILALSPRGKLLREASLPLPARERVRGPLLMRSGTLAVAAGHEVLHTDIHGNVLAQIRTASRVAALAEAAGGVLITTRSGSVESWRPGVDVRHIGTFGGESLSSQLTDPNHLLALVGQKQVVELDLRSGARRIRTGDSSLSFVGTPLAAPSRVAHVTSNNGLLVSFDAKGRETRRVLLAPVSSSKFADRTPVPMLLGAHGRIAFALPTGSIGIVRLDGTVSRSATTLCRVPRALAATGSKRYAVICASGLIAGLRAP